MASHVHLKSIQLRVGELERSVQFYTHKLGFVPLEVSVDSAALSTSESGEPSLTLTEDRHASPPPPNAAGLFHAALLLPSRGALGQWMQFAADRGVAFDGFSDHGVSEAIYLSDPDGNGLEFYADRPREVWPFKNGELAMGTLPLDVASLLAAGASLGSPLSGTATEGSRWGHLHLRVTNLDQSAAFYTAALGLELMQRFGSGARFLAADGYHHHLGLNTWGGVSEPQPRKALGLIEATFSKTGQPTAATICDPDGITITVVPGSPASSS